jgi:hypothetical protein
MLDTGYWIFIGIWRQFNAKVVKIVYFHKGFLSPFLFLYKLCAILDFSFWILDLRNSVHYN